MMPSKFDRILEDCLSRMDRGESLMDILAVYPDLAGKIKPLLMVAMLSRSVPQPVPGYTALRVGKNQLLAEMASMQAEGGFLERKPAEPPREGFMDRWARALKQLQPAYRFAMLSLVVILAGGFFTLSASASGLADNIMQTLYFSFEQVGDLLLVKHSPPKPMGDNPIFSSDYVLPDSPDNYSGDFKGLVIEDGEKDKNKPDPGGGEVNDRIETRQHTFIDKPADEVDLADVVLDDEQLVVMDEKDLEKEAKEDEKEADKAEKEDEKAADKAEKDAEKEEKEDEKDKDKDK